MDTGAETVAAACPFCASMFRDALKTVTDQPPKLLDIVQIAARGIETFTIDLTRPQFAIPVARVLCPALEKEPSEATGERLRAAIQRTGGGLRHTRGIPLM